MIVLLGILTKPETIHKGKYIASKLEEYYMDFETPQDYIRWIWSEVYRQKKEGSLKYSSHMTPQPNSKDIKSVLCFLRYVSLRMTGQIGETAEVGDIHRTQISLYQLSNKLKN